MAIERYKPTTPGQRFRTGVSFEDVTAKKPLKAKAKPLPKKAGRSRGKITVRHKGGRHKRLYREVDFKRRDKAGVPARVAEIEYDPNRSAFIARLHYQDGEKRYILAPQGLKVRDMVMAGEDAEIRVGNTLPLRRIPTGSMIHNIELTPSKGGQLVRSAGQSGILMAKEGKYAQIKLPSGEIRLILQECWATLGQLSKAEHKLVKLGKAGRARHLGERPEVRGTAMPAGAHPHGGGEGRTGTGRVPRTVYGKPARGKTRKKGKKSDRYIVKRRKS